MTQIKIANASKQFVYCWSHLFPNSGNLVAHLIVLIFKLKSFTSDGDNLIKGGANPRVFKLNALILVFF